MKMHVKITILNTLWQLCILTTAFAQEFPIPQGQPQIILPQLLNWPRDFEPTQSDLTEPTSNRIYDLHLSISDCEEIDFILSTAGNYHMALTEFWYSYFLSKQNVQNWYFTTSPPEPHLQLQASLVSFGNVSLKCLPHIAVGPKNLMDQLADRQMTVGEPIPVFTNQGNVLLVKKGNPQNIQSIWDLAKPGIKLATSNPYTENGSFSNYASSIYQIAKNEKGEDEANHFFQSIFGLETNKWVTGERIHHREVPHLIFTGEADVGIIFYHIARYTKNIFPEEFDIVPLGGTWDNPEPKPGNRISTLYVVRTNVTLSETQSELRELFMQEITSQEFKKLLGKHFIIPNEN